MKTKSEMSRRVSKAMLEYHAKKRQRVKLMEEALIRIFRMPTSGKRARNLAAKALNGKGS